MYDEIDERINPCNGCEDYNPLGDPPCKSNGGCGKPRTNADRVRSMTDEEIAEFIGGMDDGCPPRPLCQGNDCVKCWFTWLQEEVKE